MGNTDIEDSLERLDKLTKEEAQMAQAESLKMTHCISNRVQDVRSDVQHVDNNVQNVDRRVQDVDHKLDQVNRSLSH
jgi:hypothetical protein